MVALAAGNQEHDLLLVLHECFSSCYTENQGQAFLLVHCLPFLNCILNFGNVLAVYKHNYKDLISCPGHRLDRS